ncbi:UPF0481 protein At3g47200-like [Rhodamnia argentea]|uniref:UPF0481 protein At3g47200-like n=1 Tax=Rhodamnia argentea TaxID=178133 RepID=A0A8B8QHZ0_9MYRT|nr:UPF0481 protein At3g47200-like [Rhodamnia argentea]
MGKKRKSSRKPEEEDKGMTVVAEDLPDDDPVDDEPHRCISQWSIFRVPAHIRRVDEKAYNPRVVSIGPFHRDRPGLRAMEAQKVRFYERLMTRMAYEDRDVGIKKAMRKLEPDARRCYSEEFGDISTDEFVEMMALDGCFVVELMRLYHENNRDEEGQFVEEPIFATRWMVPNITRDLLMLENQLPMFVLQEIYNLTTFDQNAASLNKIALLFMEPLSPQKGQYSDLKLDDKGEHHHLLALFHSSFIPSDIGPLRIEQRGARWNRRDNFPGKLWVHEAKRLRRAGIRFKYNPGNLLNIEFANRELKIPTLFIDEWTGPLLRNLLAYEQCNSFALPYITCYAIFLTSIIETLDDMAILQDAGIIYQSVDYDEEVVDLINSLTKELVFDMHDMSDCFITQQIEDINNFCKSWQSKCIFQLSRFENILSFILPFR